jgi:hypothetical protein
VNALACSVVAAISGNTIVVTLLPSRLVVSPIQSRRNSR